MTINRTKYIIRGALLLLIVLLLINLTRKTDDMAKIAKFKFELLNKIKADSLDAEKKIELLVNENAKFNEQVMTDSPHIRSGLRYLFAAVGLLIAVEFGFFISRRRADGGNV
jgi:hypothetical protein